MKFSSPTGSLTQTALRALLLVSLTAPLASAKVVNYRYVRFHPTSVKGSALAVTLSEFQFFNGSTRLPTYGTIVTDPGSGASTSSLPGMAYDNYLNSTWQNSNYFDAYLTFDFGSPKSIDSYNFITPGFTTDGDPVSWTVEGSTDGFDWTVVDSISKFAVTDERYQNASPVNFVFPSVAKPQITAFEFSDPNQSFIVPNGTKVDLYFETSNATSVKITADNGAELLADPVNPDSDFPSITPLPNKQGIYTLTATNGGGSTTRTITIRAAAPEVQSYQYVRYTPVLLRGGAAQKAVQLSNFDFKLGSAAVPVASVTNPGGTTNTQGEGVANLLDHNTATKWYSENLSPVVFNFGSKVSFDSYSFATANDAPARDPIQWTMEGSNDNATWSPLENITSPTSYPTTQNRLADSGSLALSPSVLPAAAVLSSSSTFVAAGDPITLTYNGTGAASVAISPSVTTTGTSGTVTVTPAATTTYTLTSTSAGGSTATSSVTVTVVTPTANVNFTNFDAAPDLSLLGAAKLVNDFATFPNSPNAKRIRLTDLRPNQYGAAWATSKIKVTDGFETTFDLQITHPDYVNTVGGIGFIIQNQPDKYRASNSSVRYFPSNAVSIAFDAYTVRDLTGKITTAGDSEATVKIYVNNSTATKIINLDSKGLNYARGYHANYLVTKPTAAAYKARISYAAGKLSVYIDNKPVIEGLAITLGGAVDSDGKAYVGFNATSGYAGAYQDILNWTLTPGASTASPLAITASSFSFSPAQATLTFSSTSGKTYQITQSTDLVTWTPAGSPVTATTTSTTTTVPFTAGAKGFFRVEQTN